MADVLFDNPPVLSGSPAQQVMQLYNHLFTMSNKLNDAFMEVSIREQKAEEQRQAAAAGGGAEGESTQADDTFHKAKALIIKTAEIVRNEMDEIRTTLSQNIQAVSDQFGEYQANLEQTIEATAQGVLQQFNIEERISGVESSTEEFLRKTSQYIFSGLLDAGTQTFGIAIGYNVTNQDGTLNNNNKMATFTADRLSFYLNGAEVAYFSNNVFHIAKGEVTDGMKMGNFEWKVFSNGSIGLMKV